MPALTNEAIRARLSLRVSAEHRITHKTFWKHHQQKIFTTFLHKITTKVSFIDISTKTCTVYLLKILNAIGFFHSCIQTFRICRLTHGAIKLCSLSFVPGAVSNVPYNFKTLASTVLCRLLFLMCHIISRLSHPLFCAWCCF